MQHPLGGIDLARVGITGRPAGELRQAIATALQAFAEAGEQPTLRELASRAQVGQEAAKQTVNNMRRAGDVVIVGFRKVAYRNKPVAVYAPPTKEQPPSAVNGLMAWAASWERAQPD